MRRRLTINAIVASLVFATPLVAQNIPPSAPLATTPTPSAASPPTQTPTSPSMVSQAPATAQPTPTSIKPWYEVAAMFAWPCVTLIALLLFRAQLIEFLSAFSRHIQKASVKALGVEFEVTHIQNTEQFRTYSKYIGEKPEISGAPDNFQLLCKASNAHLSKSTKVMNLTNGCLVQVSTREVMSDNSIAAAEALVFVPDLNVKIDKTYEARKPKQVEKVSAEFIRIACNVA